jgi:hypothetical protein
MASPVVGVRTAAPRGRGETAMIKDILLNLSVGIDRDPAAEFAISVASAFDARVSAIAFAYELAVPPLIGVGHAMRPEWAIAQKTRGACDAKAAIARFDEAARRAGLPAESRTVAATFGDAPEYSRASPEDTTFRSCVRLTQIDPITKSSSFTRRCSIPGARSSSFHMFRPTGWRSTRSWFAGMAAAAPPVPSPMRCRS